jgi:putative transposase
MQAELLKEALGKSDPASPAPGSAERGGATWCQHCAGLPYPRSARPAIVTARLGDENEEIADLLAGLTTARKTGGFGPCFPHLRNVQGHPWNHKRVYRIYCELELNLH